MKIPLFCIHNRKPLCVALVSFPIVAFAARARAAATYDFNQVAIVFSQSYPSINNSGLVAFQGKLTASSSGVYTGNGGAPTFIAPGANGSFAWINGSGQVAFTNSVALGVFSVSRASGGPITTIHTYSNGSPHEVPYGMNVIADDGTVTYMSTDTGIFSGTGGPVTTVSAIPGTSASQYLGGLEGLAVSHNGTLAYEKYPSASAFSGQSIIVNRAGVEAVVITLPTALGISSVNSIAVNNSGMVAMAGVLSANTKDFGLYIGDGNTFTRVIGPGDFSGGVGAASINEGGNVAFLGSYTSNGTLFNGIYNGPDLIQNKIIQTGDPLGGSTVTQLLMGTDALNDNGEVVFWAQLANGSSGIFTASPVPEPTSLGLLTLAGFPLLLRRRRSRV